MQTVHGGVQVKTWAECGRTIYRGESLKERFEKKFDKEDGNGCWEWNAHKGRWGYGTFSVNRKSKLAHRVSYELYVGEIPDGLLVLHRCDNPACVNPKHLFIGSNADNVHDCEQKGRAVHLTGEKHGSAKLTEEQVMAIRNKRKDRALEPTLAKEYGVTQEHISRIVLRKAWTNC